MATKKQKIATGVQASTGIAGAIAQAFPGVGSAIGAGVAGVGQLVGMGIRASDEDPEFMGASGSQKSLLAGQQRNVDNILSQQGASARDVQRRYQAADMSQKAMTQQMNMLDSTDMSPWEKEALAKSYMATLQGKQTQVESQLEEWDVMAEVRKQGLASQATADAAKSAEQVRRAEWMAAEQVRNYETTKWSNFAGQIGAAADSISKTVTHGVQAYGERYKSDSDFGAIDDIEDSLGNPVGYSAAEKALLNPKEVQEPQFVPTDNSYQIDYDKYSLDDTVEDIDPSVFSYQNKAEIRDIKSQKLKSGIEADVVDEYGDVGGIFGSSFMNILGGQ